jgi:RNA polymerase sigma-70 factor (ECF subfamily)
MLDAGVLEAFRRGEDDAVRALYREYGRLAYSVALRTLGRRDLADEATQQTFVQAWRSADRLDPGRDPGPWLATIARRAAIDIYRREQRRTTDTLDDVAADDPAVTTLPPDIDRWHDRWQVRHAIDALVHDEREVVRLQHLEGLTHTEIAERLGVPVGTVKSRSHRAHRRLAEALAHVREAS